VLPDKQVIEQIIIEAITAASTAGAILTLDTEVFQVVDSLGLVTALANIQAALQVSLGPEQLIEIYACRSIGDLVLTLTGAVSEDQLSLYRDGAR
jgi:acyl carrier protein